DYLRTGEPCPRSFLQRIRSYSRSRRRAPEAALWHPALVMAEAVRLRGATKRYGAFTALDHVDLDIHRGEIFALLGPNGAGKTTTVEICEGYRNRDAGEVRVLGKDPAGASRSWKSQLGIVLQSGAGDSQLTVRELLRAQAAYYP